MTDSPVDLNRAVLISNTASGANRRNGVAAVHDLAAAAGLRNFRIDAVQALDDLLRECAGAGTRLIIVNAGDGTVCRVLDIVRGRGWFADEPDLALLHGGTTNMIHGDVGWRGRPDTALRNILSCLRAARVVRRERHVLRVHQQGPDVVRHGFFFGTHAVVRAIVHARTRLHAVGAVAALPSIAAMVWRLLRRRVENDPVWAPVPMELSSNGGPWRQAAHILLMAMSLRRLILGVRPLSRGQRAGLAELNWPDYRLLPWLWRFSRGRLDELQSVSLRGEFGWILDGELYEQRVRDGILSVAVAAPVQFLVEGRGS